jgi:hypothetical protein
MRLFLINYKILIYYNKRHVSFSKVGFHKIKFGHFLEDSLGFQKNYRLLSYCFIEKWAKNQSRYSSIGGFLINISFPPPILVYFMPLFPFLIIHLFLHIFTINLAVLNLPVPHNNAENIEHVFAHKGLPPPLELNADSAKGGMR